MKDIGKSIWEKVLDIVSPDSRKGLEGLTALVVLVLTLVFCHIFIIPLNALEGCPDWLLYLAVFVVFYLVRLKLILGGYKAASALEAQNPRLLIEAHPDFFDEV
ncbi:MAG: hypothetical protein ACETVW_00095 [Dehalococcoidia bacterium]